MALGDPLGDQWWVLDNALRLHKELGHKKGREVLLLRDMKVSYPYFPDGPVFATETPDFLAKPHTDRTVGLELVEAHRGGGWKKGSRHRQRQEAEETVLRLAEKIYYAESPPVPVHVILSWPPVPDETRVGPLPEPTEVLAGEVARLVRDGTSAWTGQGRSGDRRLELGPPELEGTPLRGVIHTISVRPTGYVGADGRDSRWGRSLSYAPATASVADLARAIAAKDRVYATCREKCGEAWLVVVLGGGPSSFEHTDDAVLDHPFKSAFDRVVLLCPSSRFGQRAATLSGAN